MSVKFETFNNPSGSLERPILVASTIAPPPAALYFKISLTEISKSKMLLSSKFFQP